MNPDELHIFLSLTSDEEHTFLGASPLGTEGFFLFGAP